MRRRRQFEVNLLSRLIFGDDARKWAGTKVDQLRKVIVQSADRGWHGRQRRWQMVSALSRVPLRC
ncbi:Hypothetical protein NGAL_HAMBI490_56600 [Neorhizobium galegae bv. officinalis]|nr:Hypothetical protein NGAL_HAMBI490_56600 [Neorhizobium galegae bv. officinalis]